MPATIDPVIAHGRTSWDRALLPPDEFEERRKDVESAALGAGVRAVVGLDGASSPGLVAYLTGYRSAAALATLILVPGAAPVLLAGLGGGRDHPFIRSIACVEDVRWYRTPAEGVLAVLAERGVESGTLGIVGAAGTLSRRGADGFGRALADFGRADFDDSFARIRRRKRERELVAMRRGAAVLEKARAVVLEARGAELHERLIAAERVVRLAGCRDVRILATAQDGSLRPWPFDAGVRLATGAGSIYLCVEHLGYWSESTVALDGVDPAGAELADALGAAATRLRDGSGADELSAAIGAGTTLEASGIGLEVRETPVLEVGSAERARSGDVVALRVWKRLDGALSLRSGTYVVGEEASRPLYVGSGT